MNKFFFNIFSSCPSSLKKLIESCWDGNPNNRPNFLQIIEKLDDCILEVAIDDVNGRKMWKENFIKDNILITEVSWDKFSEVLANYLKMDLSMKIFQGLKSILGKLIIIIISIFYFFFSKK